MRVAMLTTEDNPYDPFTQFDDWKAFDDQKGYNSCSYLARICFSSPELTQQEQNEAFEQAIDEIVALNLTGNYKKVVKEL